MPKRSLYLDSVYSGAEIKNALRRLDKLTTAALTHDLIPEPEQYPVILEFELQANAKDEDILNEAKKLLGPLTVNRTIFMG